MQLLAPNLTQMGSQEVMETCKEHPTITKSILGQNEIGSGLQEESKVPTDIHNKSNTTGPQNLNLGASFAPSLRNAASAVDLTR